MKSRTKGAFAGVAAVAVLVAGGGTLAYWNARADLGGGTISAGRLGLTPGAGAWALNGSPVPDITTVRVVPGDTVTFTGDYTITAVGDNLAARVDLVDTAVGGDLADDMQVTAQYTLSGQEFDPDTVITSANNGQVLRAALVMALPFGTAADNASQNGVLELDDVSVALVQVAS